jgi:hypothetical protein
VLTHFAGKVGKDQVSVLVVQFHPEHGVGQGFPDNSLNFYRFFFCHKNSFRVINITRTGAILSIRRLSQGACATHAPRVRRACVALA